MIERPDHTAPLLTAGSRKCDFVSQTNFQNLFDEVDYTIRSNVLHSRFCTTFTLGNRLDDERRVGRFVRVTWKRDDKNERAQKWTDKTQAVPSHAALIVVGSELCRAPTSESNSDFGLLTLTELDRDTVDTRTCSRTAGVANLLNTSAKNYLFLFF